MLAPKPSPVVQLTITKFSGAGQPVVVVGTPTAQEPQSEPKKPTLRLVPG